MADILPRNIHLKRADEERLKQFESQHPLWVLPEETVNFSPHYLAKIGIDIPNTTVGKGYIKLLYQDFIVEEITLNNRVITIDPEEDELPPGQSSKIPKVKFELVKQGLATFEALELLAETLQIPTKNIHHAGLKDSRAITAQEIVINEATPEILSGLTIPNLFVKNIQSANSIMTKGNLLGNRFTILVRSAEVDTFTLHASVEKRHNDGFWNFYSLQRFGNRLLSHKYGQLILHKKYEDVVRLFLTGNSPYESRIMQYYRKQAAEQYGDWEKMQETFSIFPYFFYTERVLLEALKAEPTNFIHALIAIQDQTLFWVYAYRSYCFNRLLSYMIRQGQNPTELPLLVRDYRNQELYSYAIPMNEIRELQFFHPELPFIRINQPQTVPTRIKPKIHAITPTAAGYIFHFDLNKGAYATTFLSQVFELYQGRPTPDWVPTQPIDSKKTLGYSPVNETIERFPKGDDTNADFEME